MRFGAQVAGAAVGPSGGQTRVASPLAASCSTFGGGRSNFGDLVTGGARPSGCTGGRDACVREAAFTYPHRTVSTPIAAPVQRLLDILPDLASEPTPRDLAAALHALPDVDLLPAPWEAWALIGLARHHTRQVWVRTVVRDHLTTDAAALALGGAFAHPGLGHGPVPGLPGWKFRFHGIGCCLKNERTGELLDVDFHGTAEHFNDYFYALYLRSLRNPALPEARLRALCPDEELITMAFEDLEATGVLLRGIHDLGLHPSPALQAAIPAVDALDRALADDTRRCWLAARLGDWLWAHELADEPLRAQLVPRVQRCRELRRARVDHALASADPHTARRGLRALAMLDPADLQVHLIAALAGPPSGLISTALELLESRWHDRAAAAVLALFERVDPDGDIPAPHISSTAARLLRRHGTTPRRTPR